MTRLLTYFVTFLIVFSPHDAFPQFFMSVYGGVGSYKMENLKELNIRNVKSLPFEAGEINNFDPGLFYGADAGIRISEYISFKLCLRYNSTGSRYGLKDYSGYYSFDQIITGRLLGFGAEAVMEHTDRMNISFSIVSGLNLTTLKIKEQLSVYGQNQENSSRFAAESVPVIPSFIFSYKVYDNVFSFLSAGYEIDSGAKIHLPGDRESVLVLNEKPLKTGWTGFRISAGLKLDLKPAHHD